MPLIEIKIDIFAIFMFLGIVQGIFLTFFYLSAANRKILANRLIALMLILLISVTLEIFLCYTGYIQYAIHLLEFSEPANFLFGPVLFLHTRALLGNESKLKKGDFKHFIFFGVYTINWLFDIIQPTAFKINNWLDAYHPNMELLPWETWLPSDPLALREWCNQLFIIHLLIYAVLIWLLIRSHLHGEHTTLWTSKNPVHRQIRMNMLALIAIAAIVSVMRTVFLNDLGDFMAAIATSLLIYIMTAQVILQSRAFQINEGKHQAKYAKSGLPDSKKSVTEERLTQLMEVEHLFLQSSISLDFVAKRLSISKHHLSQILNESFGKSFYDFIAGHRVEFAKQILGNPKQAHLTIEEIALQSGYNAKSSFNTAFKKVTGMTPSEFREKAN